MTDPALKLENGATYSFLPPIEPKATMASDADMLLQSDITQAGEKNDELNRHRTQDTDGEVGRLNFPCSEQALVTAESPLAEMAELPDISNMLESVIQLLSEDQYTMQLGLNDAREDDERSNTSAPVIFVRSP
ncbi:hypothetical protein FRC12_005820 [Ceratobasidium sp. 428]|nr:hypothetical protein FRC12_005820 [Ceratobasidium sp. 428]